MTARDPATEGLERLNVGRIDHIVLAFEDRSNLDRERARLTALLGVDDWEELGEIADAGLYIWISWHAGLELICPTRPGSIVEEHLAAHGEGFFSMVFGVGDLDAAVARVNENGGHAVPLEVTTPAGALRHYAVTREAVVGEVGGINVLLGEFALPRKA